MLNYNWQRTKNKKASPITFIIYISVCYIGLWEQHVAPYQQDNGRLTQENIGLHQQIMKLKESLELKSKELKAVIRRLEHENTDLKFLNNQYMQRLITQEKESQTKSEKILELQEKNLQAVIQTPGGRKRQIPFRRQRMELDSTLTDNPSVPTSQKAHVSIPPPDLYIADLLKVADNKMANMQRSLEQSEKEKSLLLDSIEDLKKQVSRMNG